MPHSHNTGGNVVVVAAQQNGLTIIPSPSPLTSLNYFDGKFLRAADLDTEKRYTRMLVELSNRGGGAGVVHGLDTTLASGDAIGLGPGMAIDPAGRVLLLPTATQVRIDELLDATRRPSGAIGGTKSPTKTLSAPQNATDFDDCDDIVETPPSGFAYANDLYIISIAHAEALCGHEDVFGRLCNDSCVTRTDRPFRVEGVVVRATPLSLRSQLIDTSAIAIDRRHLRSRVASAYFADDALRVGSLIGRAGLASDAWCLGARLEGGSDVPLAILARSGGTTLFLDAWTARRERMEAPARRYWAQRMAMRPWDTYLAQILQFQCQLHDFFGGQAEPGADDDPCRPQHAVLNEAAKVLEDVESHYTQLLGATLGAATPAMDAAGAPVEVGKLPGGLARIATLRGRIRTALEGAFAAPTNRVLIQGGILEAPPAGYLPVVPGSGMSVNEQVRRLMGEGVDLRFCVVPADFVPHALEEAQHMERISLVTGLDHPEAKPRVDVLVPDGVIEKTDIRPSGMGFEMTIGLNMGGQVGPSIATAPRPSSVTVRGAGRGEILPGGGMAFHLAGATEVRRNIRAPELMRALVRKPVDGQPAGEFLDAAPTSTGEEHGADFARSAVLTRMLELSARSTAHLRNLRIAETMPAGTVRPPQFSAALGPSDRRLLAIWSSMSIGADVRQIEVGDQVPLFGDFALASPARQPDTQRLVLRGDLDVKSVVNNPGGDGRTIRGQARLVGRQQELEGGDLGAPDIEELILGVMIEYSLRVGAVSALTIELSEERERDRERELYVRARWTFGPMKAVVVIGATDRAGNDHDVIEVEAIENPDVLTPGNTMYTLASAAIDVIAAIADDPTYRETALKRLFPPPQAAQQGLTVRATRDWVLFHRRRDITCDVETEVRVVAPLRRYALIQRKVGDDAELDRLKTALLTPLDDLLARLGLKPIGELQFAGGHPSLVSPAASVTQDWTGSGPGHEIAYTYMADVPPGDGSTLAHARLRQFHDTVASVTPVDTAADLDVVVGIPAPLAFPGYDGVVVELTKDVALDCIEVHAVGTDDFNAIESATTNAKVQQVLAQAGGHLGDAQFTPGSSSFATPPVDIAEKWSQSGFARNETTLVFSQTDDQRAGTPQARRARVKTIFAEARVAESGIVDRPHPDPIEGSCAAIAVILGVKPEVATDCHAIWLVNSDVLHRLVSLMDSGRPVREAEDFLRSVPGAAERIGEVRFKAGSQDLAEDIDSITNALQDRGVHAIETTRVIAQSPPQGNPDLERDRALAVLSKLGMSDNHDVLRFDERPEECSAIVAYLGVH